jgi:hypothetical protein
LVRVFLWTILWALVILRHPLMGAEVQPAVSANEQAEACPNCGSGFLGKFCYKCGEKWSHRHDLKLGHFAGHAIHELTHVDAKVFATFRYLFTRPGYLTVEYVEGRRSRYMKPLSLFLLACALMFLADSIHPRSLYNVYWLTQQDKTGKMDAAWEKLAKKTHQPKELVIERVQERIHRVTTIVQFVNVLGMAVVLLALYRKRYFVEHLVLAFHFLAFVYLASVLLWSIDFLPIAGEKLHWPVLLFKFALFVAYLTLAVRRVYQQSTGLSLVKAVVTFMCVQLVLIVTPIVTIVAAVVAAANAHT